MSFICQSDREIVDICKETEIGKSAASRHLTQFGKSVYQLDLLEGRCRHLRSELESNYSCNTMAGLQALFDAAVKRCNFGIDPTMPVSVAVAKREGQFDYQYSDAMKISNILGHKKIKAQEVAQKIVDHLPANCLIERCEISHPGFVNIKLSSEYVVAFCQSVLINGPKPPRIKKRRVVVDLSSPNIAKEMHVGHLRSTIIGDSICRILEYVGFECLRINHVGDWGTQFGMLIAHLEDSFPDYLSNVPAIHDLQRFYKDSKARFDKDDQFKARALKKVVDLQSGVDSNVRRAWKMICDISRKDFQIIYDRLNVNLIERGESFYQDQMVELVQYLKDGGYLREEEGCQVAYAPGFKVPLLLTKSDGGFTYDTSDLATLRYRLTVDRADWILYVVDIGQRDHFSTLYKFAHGVLHWYNPDVQRVEHIGFGVVLGADKKKFKTRSGTNIKLRDLLDEGFSRAAAKIAERGSKMEEKEAEVVAKALAYSCVKYADLSHNLVNDYEFSFDRMLDDRGNTAVYLLYTYMRLKSIMRKSNVSEETILAHVKKNGMTAAHPAELALLRKMVHFPEVVYRIVFETYPNYLCDYLYDLCCTTTEYYDKCPILSRDGKPDINRLAHVCTVSLVIKQCFDLLGLTPVEQM